MIVYLHGFNSFKNESSDKVKALGLLGETVSLGYDTFRPRSEIFDYLLSRVNELEPVTAIVGTSLGGYFAAGLAKELGIPSIIINPAVYPGEYFRGSIEVSLTNYITGKINKLDEKSANSYVGHDLDNVANNYNYIPLVLLDAGDTLFDSQRTKEHLDRFEVIMYDGGSHRFQHIKEASKNIEEYINICSYVTNMNE